jgi:hypothetical protein
MAAFYRSNHYLQRGYGGAILHYRSPHYIQNGFGQSGLGIGSIFRTIFNVIRPVAKSVFRNIGTVSRSVLSNPVVREIAQSAKQEALRTSTQAIADILQGKPPSQSVSQGVQKAREQISKSVRKLAETKEEEEEEFEEQRQAGRGRKRRNTSRGVGGGGAKKPKKRELGRVYQDIFTQ